MEWMPALAASFLFGAVVGWLGCYFGAGRAAAMQNEKLQRELLTWKRDR